MGLPILAAIPQGEASDIIESANAGVISLPENAKVLAQKVLKLINTEKLIADYQKNSLAAASQFDRKKLAHAMLNELREITK
jgi:glycosyltransferase involved in cell wall biosynthesis